MKTSESASWPEPSQKFTTTRPAAPGTLCTYPYPSDPCTLLPRAWGVGGRERRQGQNLGVSAQPLWPHSRALVSQEVRSPRPYPPSPGGGRPPQTAASPSTFLWEKLEQRQPPPQSQRLPTHPASPNLATVPPDTPQRRDSEAPARAIGSRGAEKLLEIRANANSVPLPREGLPQSSPQPGQTWPGHHMWCGNCRGRPRVLLRPPGAQHTLAAGVAKSPEPFRSSLPPPHVPPTLDQAPEPHLLSLL